MAEGNPKVDLRIVNVSPQLKESVKNIAANKGETQTLFLRKLMREIAESYPDMFTEKPSEIRNPKIHKQTELNMTFIPEDVQDKVNNIAGNMWVSINGLLKIEVQKLVDAYPEHMKKPPRQF